MIKNIVTFFLKNETGKNIIVIANVLVVIGFVANLFFGNHYISKGLPEPSQILSSPLYVACSLIGIVYAPYLLYRSRQADWRALAPNAWYWRLANFAAVMFGSFPTGILYVLLMKYTGLPLGLHNILGFALCGWIYVNTVCLILKRQFQSIEEIAPLYKWLKYK